MMIPRDSTHGENMTKNLSVGKGEAYEKESKLTNGRQAIGLDAGITSGEGFQNSIHQNSPHSLLKHIPIGSDSVGLRWGQRICFSIKFPDNPDAAGPRTTL